MGARTTRSLRRIGPDPPRDTLTYDRLRDLGIVVTMTNQVVTELEGNFGTPAGQQAQGIIYDEIISKLTTAD